MLVLCWYWRKRKFYFCVAAHGSGLPVEIMVQSFCITKLHVAKIQSIILDVAVMKGKELTVVDSNGEVSSRGGLDSFGLALSGRDGKSHGDLNWKERSKVR